MLPALEVNRTLGAGKLFTNISPTAPNMKTLIIGATDNADRYAYKALKLLRQYGHEVVAIGNRSAIVDGVPIIVGKPTISDIDTITLYINPAIQRDYGDYILSLRPRRIIFNPGTENAQLAQLARQNGIETENACTLVLLQTRQY